MLGFSVEGPQMIISHHPGNTGWLSTHPENDGPHAKMIGRVIPLPVRSIAEKQSHRFASPASGRTLVKASHSPFFRRIKSLVNHPRFGGGIFRSGFLQVGQFMRGPVEFAMDLGENERGPQPSHAAR